MKYFFLLLLSTVLTTVATSQTWTSTEEINIARKGIQDINPQSKMLVKVDDALIKNKLWQAPWVDDVAPSSSNVQITVPAADGRMITFNVSRYATKQPGLAAKFPNIRSYIGVDISNSLTTLRADYTVHGLRAVINDAGRQTFIDHYQRNDLEHKIVYFEDEYQSPDKAFTCHAHDDGKDAKQEISNSRFGTCDFQSFELAVSATDGYCNFHGAATSAGSALVASAVETTINRINAVYEREVGARFILVDDTDQLWYYNAADDPFAPAYDTGAALNINQTTTDATIGNGNYDIGHVFIQEDGNNGVAQLRGLCNNGGKARGVTSRTSPTGDPFDIDYVAHEMGHQFGGNHTQNNNCNRNSNTAVEAGSGTSIMGYAGICAPNPAFNSHDNFSAVNIAEMKTHMDGTASCNDIISNAGNSAPVVTAIPNKTLPISTPFVLAGQAMDGDGDAMLFTWDQVDNQVATMPPLSTNTGGPAFRALPVSASPDRYCPSLPNILSNNTTWEVLTSVDRTMNFTFTARDVRPGSGSCTDEATVTLTFDDAAGPFIVNTANTTTTYLETDIVTIDWDVANTDVAPVSCSEVDILLSYDGGLTYPVTLLTNTANDGTADITLPLGLTTQGRFMVKCSDNYFFDINDADFTIEEGSPTYTLATNPTSAEICNSENTYSFVLESNSVQGYNTPITLVLSGLPAGAAGSFTTNPLTPGQNTTVQLTGLSGTVGTSQITINGSSGIIAKDAMLDLTLAPQPNAPSLSTPANNETDVDPTTTLTWSSVTGAGNYEYRIGLTAGASDAETGIVASNAVTVSNELASDTDHFWAVRSLSTAGCAPSAWSPTFTFRTKVCKTFTATDLPIAISSSGTPTITSDITIRDRGTVNDLNLVSLIGTHSYVDDLIMSIIAPDNAETIVWNRPCGSQDNFDINLDDDVPAGSWPCPPIDGGTYRPSNALSFYDNKSIKGTWTLEVFDRANQDGGSLNSYGYYMCLDDYCDLTVDKETYLGGGSLSRAIACAVPGDTIYLESSIPNQIIDIGNNVININIDDLTIIAEAPITLRAANFTQTMFIGPSADVTLIGFSVENTAGIGIVNTGTLTLQDISVYSDGGAEQVYNAGSGSLTVKGQCNLEVED